jgi:hypothetical protein
MAALWGEEQAQRRCNANILLRKGMSGATPVTDAAPFNWVLANQLQTTG